MIIHSASFVSSSNSIEQCPVTGKPEFGFIGRSNVGKSSLINMLTGRKNLARISGSPGKTRTINHFLINNTWYLVDLPGYGYARVASATRSSWIKAVEEYILKRNTLISLFLLIDSRISPQASDLSFIEFLGLNQIPFARVFTKTDKLPETKLKNAIQMYDIVMSKTWDEMPSTFISSTVKKTGRDDILGYIEETFNNLSNPA
jgi:GTP-binding protein